MRTLKPGKQSDRSPAAPVEPFSGVGAVANSGKAPMKELKESIAAHPFVHGLKPEYMELLASGAKVATYTPGQFLFHEGEPADRLYLIENGRISLEAHEPADGTLAIQNVGAGEVIGWSWLFPPFVWHLQARVLEPTKVIILNGAHLLIVAERNHEFGYELMKRVAQILIERLHSTRQKLVAQLLESSLEG